MGITRVWKGFFYFLVTIVIIAVILLLALPIALIVLVIITALAILGFIIRLIFSRRSQSQYDYQHSCNQTKAETKVKETAKENIVDAEIIEETNKEEAPKNKSEGE